MREDRTRDYTLISMVTFKNGDRASQVADLLLHCANMSPSIRIALTDNSGDLKLTSFLSSALASVAPQVDITVQDINLGFAPAVNFLHGLACARWGPPARVLLINPDISASGSDVIKVVERACVAYQHRIGIYSPLLVDAAGRVDRGSARRAWNYRRLFAEVVGTPRVAALLGSKVRQVNLPIGAGVVEVDIASGGFMCIAGEVFEHGLDTTMPMYLEDQEVCIRAKQMGLRVVVDTSLKVLHLGGSSRKSVSRGMEDIRMMELAQAPLHSLMLTRKQSSTLVVHLIVLAGAVGRAILSIGAAPVRNRRIPGWLTEQLLLSAWFARWAIGRTPRFDRIH